MVIETHVTLTQDETLLYTPSQAAQQVLAALGGDPTNDYATCWVRTTAEPGQAGTAPEPTPPVEPVE